MSEKEGKGFRSSLKSTPSNFGGGKDDGSAKSKRARKVHFDPQGQGTPEPKYKFLSGSDEHFQSVAAKGGKGDKAAKTGRTSLPKESQPLELKIDKELPENAKCLMDCEAAQILEGINKQIPVLSEDRSIKFPPSFDRGLQYATNGSHYSNPQSVRQLLEPLKKHGVCDGEMCVIANVCPESDDEIFALVPSLKGKGDSAVEPLKGALMALSKLK